MYRGKSKKGPYEKINKVLLSKELREYTDSGVTPGGYYYYVASVNKKQYERSSERDHVKGDVERKSCWRCIFYGQETPTEVCISHMVPQNESFFFPL